MNMFTFVSSVVVFFCFVFLWCYCKWTNRHFNKLAAKMKGPLAYPLIGSMLEFTGTPTQKMDAIKKFSNEYGTRPFKLWLGPFFSVCISKPEDIQVILHNSKTLKKPWTYKYFKGLGEGLVTAPVDKWKKHRRIINPAFNTKQLKQFFPVFNEKNQILVSNLKKELDKTVPFNLWDYLLPTTLDIISQTAIGYNLNTQSIGESEFGNAIMKLQKMFAMRIFSPWLYFNKINSIYERLSGTHKIYESLYKLPLQMINEKKQTFSLRKLTNKVSDDDDQKKNKIFLDILLELNDAGSNFSDDDLRDEVLTMMLAGSETTAITTCFCLFLLAVHQDVQDKVCDEFYNVLSDDDNEPISIENINKLSYLEQVLMETLRLYPTVPLFSRELEDNVKIFSGDYLLPKGTTVNVIVASTHQNSELYPNPSTFNPDNFSGENISKRPKYSFLPFSGGQRNCIGSKYAMLSMKVLLCKFLQNYSVHTELKMSDIQLSFDLLTRSANGYPVTIRSRNRSSTFK